VTVMKELLALDIMRRSSTMKEVALDILAWLVVFFTEINNGLVCLLKREIKYIFKCKKKWWEDGRQQRKEKDIWQILGKL